MDIKLRQWLKESELRTNRKPGWVHYTLGTVCKSFCLCNKATLTPFVPFPPHTDIFQFQIWYHVSDFPSLWWVLWLASRRRVKSKLSGALLNLRVPLIPLPPLLLSFYFHKTPSQMLVALLSFARFLPRPSFSSTFFLHLHFLSLDGIRQGEILTRLGWRVARLGAWCQWRVESLALFPLTGPLHIPTSLSLPCRCLCFPSLTCCFFPCHSQ